MNVAYVSFKLFTKRFPDGTLIRYDATSCFFIQCLKSLKQSTLTVECTYIKAFIRNMKIMYEKIKIP